MDTAFHATRTYVTYEHDRDYCCIATLKTASHPGAGHRKRAASVAPGGAVTRSDRPHLGQLALY